MNSTTLYFHKGTFFSKFILTNSVCSCFSPIRAAAIPLNNNKKESPFIFGTLKNRAAKEHLLPFPRFPFHVMTEKII